ncbi:MAG: outer membrane beta-barrel protein [Chitinophagaceae bacterium]
MHRRLVLSLYFVFASLCLIAQETTQRFQVKDWNGKNLAYATVLLIGVPDSTTRQEKGTDSSGSVSFTLTQGKPYRVEVSLVGYTLLQKAFTAKGDNSLYTLVLAENTRSLAAVVVTANRPVMRQEDDKTIVDPENLAATSTNSFEILEKIPGLFVDQDGNIYLNSTTPATVYINGREQKMSSADIATMLKSLPPNSIASIEILRTPSARYDASGSGGIVNVVLKKGVRIGLTGSVNTGFNQGRFGNHFFGVNLNNNTGRLNTYINLQYSRRKTYDLLQTSRFFGGDTVLSQEAYTKYPANSYYLGFGAGYQINKKWELNWDGRLSINESWNNSINLSQLTKQSNAGFVEITNATVQNSGKSSNLNQGLTLRYKWDSLGSEWTTDVSYNYSPNKTDQQLNTRFFGSGIFSADNEGRIDNRLAFFSAQSNLVKKFARKLTLETGIKTTNVRFKNQTDYFNGKGNSRVPNPSRSGAYTYSEGIHSGYLQASKTSAGITLKLGTRVENTNMRGEQQSPKDTSFLLNRTDLFPYVYLSRGIMKIAGYDLRAYLVYRRTISRPAYEYLNPSVRIIDPYLFETGNPSLRPQFTNNYEANVSFEERPVFAIGYNDTKDIFTQVVYPSDSNRLSRTYDNLGSNKETYFRLLGAIPPGKRYFIVAGAQYNHNYYNGIIEGKKPLSYKRGSWSLFSYQTFKLTPLTIISVNGFVRFNGMQQFYELSTFGSLRASISQQFFKKKLTLSVSGEDLLYTNRNDFILTQGSVRAAGFRKSDTRRIGLNLRYNFGFRKREDNDMFNIESPEKTN